MAGDKALDQNGNRIRVNVTLQDVATRAGTSISVASSVLNGSRSKSIRVSKETQEAVFRVAEELGYRRNPIAQGLATGRTRVIGLMLPSMDSFADHDPFYSMVISGVTSAASRHRYNVMLFSATPENEGHLATEQLDRRIDGIILSAPSNDSPILAECRRQGLPFVAVSGVAGEGGLSVGVDDYQGARLAVEHLVALGHRRIAHLSGRPEMATSQPREDGYRDALKTAGLESEDLVRVAHFNRRDGHEAMAELLRLPRGVRPTAVFAGNDLSAHGALDAIQEAGFVCPDDIAIVGFDDTWYATITRPALTTIHAQVSSAAALAASTLIDLLEGRPVADREVVLPVSLVIRESCGARARLPFPA